ncbi:UNVERIFIED_CONTAM: hypothetical protein HDU68_002436 [Siphonaria sp. JEL0065]|nr:hypothetical protein HDU68_002436 [Siphonaria sp. JEL0065]
MQLIEPSTPGNRHFQGTVEYATLINFFFGPAEHIIGQLLLFLAVQSLAMTNIIFSAQTMDSIFVDIFHKSCAVALPGNGINFGWYCVSNDNSTAVAVALGGSSPFGSQPILFSLGLLTVIALCIPLAMSNLDDNIQVQIIAFVVTLVVAAEWFVESTFTLEKHRVQPVSLSSAFANLLGPIILNFSCTLFVPSWINMKHKNVNAQRTVWVTMLTAVFLFGFIGVFPALAFDGLKVLEASSNPVSIISILTDEARTPRFVVNKVFCYLFSIVMLLPAIPVGFIVSEQNLSQNFDFSSTPLKKYGLKFATFILPWLCCIPLQTGSALGVFINWTGVLLVSPANFVIPFVIYLKCLKFRHEYNEHRTLSLKQTQILKEVHNHSTTIVNFLNKGHQQRKSTFLGRALTRFRPATTLGTESGRLRHSPTSLSQNSVPPSRGESPDPHHHIVSQPTLRGAIKIVEWDDGSDIEDDTPNDIELQQDSQFEGSYHGSHLTVPEGTAQSYHSEGIEGSAEERVGLSTQPQPQPASFAEEEFWLNESLPDPETERIQHKRTRRFLRPGGGGSRDPSPFRGFMGASSDGAPAVSMISLSVERTMSVNRLTGGTATPTDYGAFDMGLPANSNSDSTIEQTDSDGQNLDDDWAIGTASGEHVDYDITSLQKRANMRGGSVYRKQTLPVNEQFVSPPFVAVPFWLPVEPKYLAMGLLCLTTVLSLIVIILQAISALIN